MFGKDDLLFSALNGSGKVVVVRLLELLACLRRLAGFAKGIVPEAYNVAELGLCD